MPAAPKANPPIRTLLGPGPSPVNPRVLQALSLPVVGHLDPKFLELMDQSMAMLRELFQTCNQARYAPQKSSQELASLIPQLESVLRELQQLKG